MNETDENLRRELLAMREEDSRVREELAKTGALFDGYHPAMEAVHLKNAALLEELIERHGWLGARLVGADGAEAAWLVAQHAISRPDLQRKVLEILRAEAERGAVPAWQAAYLEDRINIFEGKPQRYGTHFDWDERGALSPHEIFEPETIDERRAAVGLSVPFARIVEKQRAEAAEANEKPPGDFAERRRVYREWLRTVGWRS